MAPKIKTKKKQFTNLFQIAKNPAKPDDDVKPKRMHISEMIEQSRLKKLGKKIQSEFETFGGANFQGDIRKGLGRQSTMLGGGITALGSEPEPDVNRTPISIDDLGLPQINEDFDFTSIGIPSLAVSNLKRDVSAMGRSTFFSRILRGIQGKKIQDDKNRAESVTAFQKRLSASSLGRRSTTNRRANLLRSQFDEEDLRLGVL